MTKTLKLWETATNNLVQAFVNRHFGRTAYWYFIAEECGGVVDCCDRFFDLSEIVDFTRYGYTSEEMFAYKDQALEILTQNPKATIVNIKNWKKIKNTRLLTSHSPVAQRKAKKGSQTPKRSNKPL